MKPAILEQHPLEFTPATRRRVQPNYEPEPSIDLERLPQPSRPRLDSIDLLRGIVMVLMALDHVRDFFGANVMNPRDVHQPALFLTRWVTHFCAPTFIFLAGVSAFLYGQRGGCTKLDVSRFLVTRGLWLVVMELTLVNFGWTFDLRFSSLTLQVIWAIGWSMVALSALIWLPRIVIGAIALTMIAGHNVLDGIGADGLGVYRGAWFLLHEPGMLIEGPRLSVLALYPLVPWVGVMAAGYAIGPVMLRETPRRQRRLFDLGLAIVIGFTVIRASGLYGDPVDWTIGDGVVANLLAFLNCEKYPPSLLYLMMTLGPALMALALLDGVRGRIADVFITFGRVPFLYYLAHIYLIHALAVIATVTTETRYGLPSVYAIWPAVVAMLYPLCRWFAGVKQRRRDWWLSYL